jgi:hypothetical protein
VSRPSTNLGILSNIGHLYVLKCNAESGLGRYDIAAFPKDKSKLGILIEIKAPNPRYGETMESAILEAEEQLRAKNYTTNFTQEGIERVLRIAIAFQGKELIVKEIND